MKKSDLKNRLRRRTADKLYDFFRTAGHAPTQLPASQSPLAERQGKRGSALSRRNQQAGRRRKP